jgi:hypothetical protein
MADSFSHKPRDEAQPGKKMWCREIRLVKTSLNSTNHPSRPRHMPEDLNCGLARKQPTGETTWQAFALFVQVATQVVEKVDGLCFFFFFQNKKMRMKDDGKWSTKIDQG